MENRPSSDPRDQAIRAALHDGTVLATMVAAEMRATYWGAERALYRQTLAGYVADLGGRLEPTQGRDLIADFGGRRITIRFG